MGTVSIKPMTTDMFYSYFKEYENDPDLFFEGQEYVPYEYSDEKVAKYILRQKDLDRVILAIMCDEEIVGEIIIKNIEKGKCATMGLALKNASYKDKADTIKKNTRSKHVLEKVGFTLIREDDDFYYYSIER